MTPVLMNEVQGIVLRGYEDLKEARCVLLKVTDAAAARAWLGEVARGLTSAQTKPTARAVNVAFTFAGLKRLGLPEACLDGFSSEFKEGMDTGHRQRVLGDTDARSPAGWDWGMQSDAENVHVLLMVYADTKASLEPLYRGEAERFQAAKLVEHPKGRFDLCHLTGRKEHFGFRDGISQPFVAGVVKDPPRTEREKPVPENTVPAGEFLLGYANAYGTLPPSPSVPAGDPGGPIDFGRNGSYLVVRQLEQDVRAFWNFLIQATAVPGVPEPAIGSAVDLAARMVGRWPSGAPLALFPTKDDPTKIDEDAFAYRKDPFGLHTPIGSHTRRSNPRDSIEPGPGGEGRISPEASSNVTRLHRIIRRGRPYGPPVAESMDPVDILKAADTTPDVKRGLLFLCFNANIARQFEFIQQTWINNPKFGGLYEDTDPLMGRRHPPEMSRPADVFTQQAEPVRRRVPGLPDFVRVRGGGYFFMPGKKAVEYLAGLQAPPETTGAGPVVG